MTKFNGEKDYLDQKLSELKISGAWGKSPGKQTFRTADGGILTWYENGTLQVQGKGKAVPHFHQICKDIENNSHVAPSGKDEATDVKVPALFIVYGHDTTSREQLELILTRMGIEHFILGRTSGGGKTIIEALEGKLGKEGESDVGIVLLTPDDFGYSKKDGDSKIKPRARQNVILEMGMLLSKLGRPNTIILVKGDLERPSDLDGIIYHQFEHHVKEVGHNLIERLEETGFPIDHKKANTAIR